MPTFKIINLDQGFEYTHQVKDIDRDTAIKNFSAGHYGRVISCEEVIEEKKCPHCGKIIS